MCAGFFESPSERKPVWEQRGIGCLDCGQRFVRANGYVGYYCPDCRDTAEDDDDE